MTQDDSSSAKGVPTTVGGPNSELARALQELTRGEQTAAALEANLSSLESKIDQLLASFEKEDVASNVAHSSEKPISTEPKDEGESSGPGNGDGEKKST